MRNLTDWREQEVKEALNRDNIPRSGFQGNFGANLKLGGDCMSSRDNKARVKSCVERKLQYRRKVELT